MIVLIDKTLVQEVVSVNSHLIFITVFYKFLFGNSQFNQQFLFVSMSQLSGNRQVSAHSRMQESSMRGNYESQAINETLLKWSSIGEGEGNILIHGESDFAQLSNLRNILLTLQSEFTSGGSQVVFAGEKKDDFNKRLILLEGEIDGLLKRKIQYSARDEHGATRILDYSGVLNEKETQIVELEKKINNLEERLRRASARELELENHITQLYADLKRKEDIINAKNDIILAEVASSNAFRESLNKIKRNVDTNRSRIGDLERTIFEGVTFPEAGSFEIKADVLTKEGALSRSKGFQNMSQNQKYKTQLIQLFREFERVNNQDGISDAEIERVMEGFLMGLQGTRIRDSVQLTIHRVKTEENYNRLRDQFGVAVGIFQAQLEKIKRENPNIRIDTDARIFQILKDQQIQVYKTAGDIVHLERFSERTVEVPVQDARTKHLIHMLAIQIKKFCAKYPKLQGEMDVRLTEFFQQEIIDMIEVDEVDRLVEIVKYVPQVVKVENVYAYSSEKSRKVEFHLRVLVKALLEELEKLKRRTGAVLEMDEGIIGMINQQIMGVVDVDDILKIFRVVPKIVEVQKIVEKIVDRIVEVPQVVSVQKIVEKIVEVEKIREIQRIVNVPLEVPVIVTNVVEKIVPVERIVEKIVEVPQIIERIVEVIREVPKVEIVEKIVQKYVEVEKIIEVERIVNHIQTEIQVIEVIVEKNVPVEKIIQVPRQIEVIVEKIVERIVEVPKIIEVEKIIEKLVPVIEYRNAKQIENHIEIRNNIVDRIIEKPIPIIQTVEKIIEVPQIIEKIVKVENTIREPYEVIVIQERIVVQQSIREIEKIVQVPVTVVKEVPKEVERIIEIPVIHQKIKIVQEIIEKPVVQRIENTIVKEVYLRDPIIVKEPKTIEVERIVNHYIDVPKPIKYIEEKIVEVIKHVDRIKEIKVPVEKIIEKMVEVPKVVEVEKIVEKIVVVPRVVEKVVEVIKIVERVVPKIIKEEVIREVERIVQVPVIQDRVMEVEVPKNVYIEVEKIVEKIVDKLVEVPKYEEKIINNEVIIEKVIEVIREVPREIEVEKIVYSTIEVPQVVELERQIIVPVEVPIPVERIIQKMVPVTETIEKIVQVPQVIQKIVDRKVETVEIQEVTRVEERIIENTQFREIVKEVPYIQERLVDVPTIVEKIVPVQSIVQEIVTAQQIVQKIIERSTIVPKIHEVERIREKVVEVPKIVEIERLIPQIVNVNRYIQNIVEKIVEVPILVEQIKEVVRENEKIVEVRNEYETIKEVQSIVEKAVVVEKFKEVVKNINHIEKVLQIIDRFEQTPVQVMVQQEKLVEVPHILEKIVEKIVVMPQIVEVLRYVHEVTEREELGVAVGVDVSIHEQKLKLLGRDIKGNLDIVLTELRKLKGRDPNLKIQIELIEKFLLELDTFVMFPKIFQVPKEKIVEKIVQKDRIVTVPTKDERSIKMELTLSLLVEKLILELKRISKENSSVKLKLEDDINLIFFNELDASSNLVGGDFNAKLKSFSDSIYRKFEWLGNGSMDHQIMLNSFLQERFLMANLVKNANMEIEKTKNISVKREEALKMYESQVGILEGYMTQLRSNIGGLSEEHASIITRIFGEYDNFIHTRISAEPMKMLGELAVTDQRIQSLLREKDAQILQLRDRIFSIEKGRIGGSNLEAHQKSIDILREENLKLKNELSILRSEHGSVELIAGYKDEIISLQRRNLELEQEISNLKSDLSNYKKENEVGLRIYESNVKDSGITRLDPTSPAQRYEVGSPDHGIRMVQSEYRGGASGVSGEGSASRQQSYDRGATYESRVDSQSGSSSGVRQQVSYGGQNSGGDQSRYRSNNLTSSSGSGAGYSSSGAYGTGAGQSSYGGDQSGSYSQTRYGTGASGYSQQGGYTQQSGSGSGVGGSGSGIGSSYTQQGASGFTQQGRYTQQGGLSQQGGSGSGVGSSTLQGGYTSSSGTGGIQGSSFTSSTQQYGTGSGAQGQGGSSSTSRYGTNYRYGGDKQ